MKSAAVTFVYNENVNLPIWVRHYGDQFGLSNLFILDRGSTDGSTDNLGPVNVIRLQRDPFDEMAKTKLMSSFHASLTSIYDAVIITDCDEILQPNPIKYRGLSDYIEKMTTDYINATGIDIVHLIHKEEPIDLSQPILSQRSFGRFSAPECKHLLSKVPINWLPGFHSSNKPPIFDEDLINFHLKYIDYNSAMKRQRINQETIWSLESLDKNFGSHHRYSFEKFVHQGFLVPIDLYNKDLVKDFSFNSELDAMREGTVQDGRGNYRIPTNITKMVKIADHYLEFARF